MALLMDSYKGRLRTRAIAYYGAVAGLGSSFGLVIGGIIASYFSWRWGFLLNVPIGIVLSIMSLIAIKDVDRQRTPLDIFGNITSLFWALSVSFTVRY
ncbi:MAG: MFS transporter [Oenococcus sp.]|uniref:MFS transporter n=1 Tax=Oenococcus sp. TaxID=1979414 RepID=UPI0039EB89B3